MLFSEKIQEDLSEKIQEDLSDALKCLAQMCCCHQQKIQKMSHFWHKDHNTGNKYDNLTNNAIYFIYSLSSIRWYISFLHFKTFKIQFHGIITLHYVQACKIHIYMPRNTLLSLLITYLVPTLIPIWPQSHGLW